MKINPDTNRPSQDRCRDGRVTVPEHLRRFPCMLPWEGNAYADHRIMVICESHYMPKGSTINHDADRWYSAEQDDLTESERCYINTRQCVRDRLSPDWRPKNPKNAYVRINEIVSFDRIVFANYFYRPAKYKCNIWSVGVTLRDEKVSKCILTWLVAYYQPKFVIVAAKTSSGPYAGPVLSELNVSHRVIYHPMVRAKGFGEQLRDCLLKVPD